MTDEHDQVVTTVTESPWASLRTVKPEPPPSWRELCSVLLLIALADATVYRGHGFAGYALLLAVAPCLVLAGASHFTLGASAMMIGAMLAATSLKLIWCGSALLVAAGFFLLIAWSMCLTGQIPHVLEVIVFGAQIVLNGFERLRDYSRSAARHRSLVTGTPTLSLLMPLAAFLVFGLIFLLANPDLLKTFSEQAARIMNHVRDWLVHFSLLELLFWFAVMWLSVGMLRPLISRLVAPPVVEEPWAPPYKPAPAPLFAAFRNTLLTATALFAAYLFFEFQTLWFRKFPPGFYYSGYAHEGAAWLTVALALATLTLSLVFRGPVLADLRRGELRRLAWIWSAENIILAIAVYNRLFIYVGFNGMTRMRVVGLFGISVVVVGFLLVIVKIIRQHNFAWLVQRQLWALGLAIWLFALTPVDAIVVRYNVRRILAGDPAPSVQICVHPINSEGLLLLTPLLDSDNVYIREGVRALLARADQDSRDLAARRRQLGWTTFQLADRRAWNGLAAERGEWSMHFAGNQERDAVFQRFYDYAYQWY